MERGGGDRGRYNGYGVAKGTLYGPQEKMGVSNCSQTESVWRHRDGGDAIALGEGEAFFP